MSSPMDRRQFLRYSALGTAMLGGGAAFLAACGSSSTTEGAATTAKAAGTTAAGATATTAASAAKDLGKGSIQFNWIKNVQFAGFYLADKNGFYKQEGLSGVDLMSGGPTVQDLPVVVSGKALLGVSVTEVVAGAIKEGGDIKVVGALFQKNPFGIMSLSKNPIKTPQDMIGKKIGVQAVNDGLWDALLKINKIDPSKVTKIVADFDPKPLVNGEADGWFSFITNEPNVLRAEGVSVETLALADFGFSLYQQLLTTSGKALKDNRDAVKGLLRASLKGWELNGKDTTVAAKLAVDEYGKDLGLNVKACEAENADQMKIVLTDTTKAKGIGYMDPAELDKTIATLADLGLTVKKDAFTNELLDEIYKNGPSLL